MITTTTFGGRNVIDIVKKGFRRSAAIDELYALPRTKDGTWLCWFSYFDALMAIELEKRLAVKNIVEVSPYQGWSTAILIAGAGDRLESISSFDYNAEYRSVIEENLDYAGLPRDNWHFIPGDFRTTYSLDIATLEQADYLFLDSEHTHEFAEFYIANVFDHLKPSCLISVHDVYNMESRQYKEGAECTIITNHVISSNKYDVISTNELILDPEVTELYRSRLANAIDDRLHYSEQAKYSCTLFLLPKK